MHTCPRLICPESCAARRPCTSDPRPQPRRAPPSENAIVADPQLLRCQLAVSVLRLFPNVPLPQPRLRLGPATRQDRGHFRPRDRVSTCMNEVKNLTRASIVNEFGPSTPRSSGSALGMPFAKLHFRGRSERCPWAFCISPARCGGATRPKPGRPVLIAESATESSQFTPNHRVPRVPAGALSCARHFCDSCATTSYVWLKLGSQAP